MTHKIPISSLAVKCDEKELLDCPFCGSDVVEVTDDQLRTRCEHCGAMGPYFHLVGSKSLKLAWNTRTSENAKSVLVIDEENYAKLLFAYVYPKSDEKLWEHLEENFLKEAKYLSKNASQFMRIERDT